MNKYLTCAIIFLSLVLVSCAEDDEPEWKASDVCPEAGTNRYGMPNRGTFVDERDGRVYKYTTIGDQVWMAENLKYELPYPYSICYGKETCYMRQRYEYDDGVYTCMADTSQLAKIAERLHSTCETNECIADEFCEKYGRYYTLMEGAKDGDPLNRDLIDTICPKGWHVPTKAEWETLMGSVGDIVPRIMDESVYDTMDSNLVVSLKKKGGPINACGFSAVYVGEYFDSGSLEYLFSAAVYATSTAWNEFCPNALYIGENMTIVARYAKQSLRCIKD